MNAKRLGFALLATAAAPLMMAPGNPRCPQCEIRVQQSAVTTKQGETAWRELAVVAGVRQYVTMETLRGDVKAELVPFANTRLYDLHCVGDQDHTRCEFEPEVDGRVGLSIKTLVGPAETLIEYGAVGDD